MSEHREPTPPVPPAPPEPGGRGAVLRLVAVVAVFAGVAVGIQLSGWQGPDQLRDTVDQAGPLGAVVFVVGYALLVLLPTPASVLTIAAGALFGIAGGVLLAWAGALLGAVGGFLLGRVVGRGPVDRLLRGRLRQADALLSRHGVPAVLAVRLLPLFPFTPLNYACGVVALRFRDYLLGTAVGILPGTLAYVAVGAAGSDPRGIALGAGGLVLLAAGGSWWGRRLLGERGEREPQETRQSPRVTPGTTPATAGRSDA